MLGSNKMNSNAAVYFVDRHIDEGRADKDAFVEVDGAQRTISYGELSHQSAIFAGALSRADIRRDERMAMIVLDTIEFPIAFWGALKAGVTPIPLNTLLSTEIYHGILQDSRPTCVMISKELWETVSPALADIDCIRQVIVIGDNPKNTTNFDDYMRDAHALSPINTSGDELAFWLYSSGSTGLPKGVRHIHSSLQATSETFGQQVLGIKQDDVVYSAAKLFFAYGLGNAMSFPMSAGATTLLFANRPTPDAVTNILEKWRPTIFCGVPTLFAALLAHLDQSGGELSHNLRINTSAGEALPREVGERWNAITKTDIVDGVGSTEMLHIFLSNRPNDLVYGTSGTAVPGYTVRLVDESGNDCAIGEIGELIVNGPSSAESYWNRRDKSKSTFEGHWTRTGDKYEQSPDGRYIYCGRTDDMFKVSGIWLSPFEVEQAIVEHPAVLEAAVVPYRDGDDLEKPQAFVVLQSGKTEADVSDLKELVQHKIGKWKYPRKISIVPELPKTATGKIQRFKLRD